MMGFLQGCFRGRLSALLRIPSTHLLRALCWLAVALLSRAGCVSVGVVHASGLPNTEGSFGAKTCFIHVKYRSGF